MHGLGLRLVNRSLCKVAAAPLPEPANQLTREKAHLALMELSSPRNETTAQEGRPVVPAGPGNETV
jgi:hypothetical protein